MDTTSRIAIASCVMSLVVSVPSFADVTTNHFPTIAEVDAEIASLANLCGAKTLWRDFEATSGRIKEFQDSAPSQEVFRVQWHVVSNMFSECYLTAALTNDIQINYSGMESILWLHLTKYKLFHVDTNALMYVAYCVSNALPVDVSREDAIVWAGVNGEYMPEFGSTNALTGERVVLNCHSVTNRFRMWWQWEKPRRMKRGFNYSQSRFRRMVFNRFCELMLHDLSEYPEPTRRSLWEEFCRLAGASDAEKTEAYRDLYDDYKIVYP